MKDNPYRNEIDTSHLKTVKGRKIKTNELKHDTKQMVEDKLHQHIHNVFSSKFKDDVITSAFYSIPFHECVEESIAYSSSNLDVFEIKESILDGLSKECDNLREAMIKDGYSQYDAIYITNSISNALRGNQERR